MNPTTRARYFGGIYGSALLVNTINGALSSQIHNCTFTGAISPQPDSSYNGVGMIGGNGSEHLSGACYYLGTSDNLGWNGYQGVGNSGGGENTNNTICLLTSLPSTVPTYVMKVYWFRHNILDTLDETLYGVYKAGLLATVPEDNSQF